MREEFPFYPLKFNLQKTPLHLNIINPVIWWTSWLLGGDLVSSTILNKVFVLVLLEVKCLALFYSFVCVPWGLLKVVGIVQNSQ